MPPPIFHPPVLDISHWIEVDDFSLLNPMPWLIITKATESDYYLDATYPMYADMIRDAGIRLGAYHFARPGNEMVQADHFCDFIETVGLRGDEVLAYDLETDGITLAQVKNFLDMTQQRTGIRPIIYSTELRIESLYLTANSPPSWLLDEWLWIAEYVTPASNEIPDWIVPAGIPKSRVGLFQYSDDGEIVGIPRNNVDLNIISTSFINHLGLTEPTQPDNGGSMTTIYEIRSNSNSTRSIREQGSVSSAKLLVGGDLLPNKIAKAGTTPADVVTYSENVSNGQGGFFAHAGDVWWRVYDNNGTPVSGWIAEKHLGQTLITKTLRETEDPNPLPTPTPNPPHTIEFVLAPGSRLTVRDKDGIIILDNVA